MPGTTTKQPKRNIQVSLTRALCYIVATSVLTFAVLLMDKFAIRLTFEPKQHFLGSPVPPHLRRIKTGSYTPGDRTVVFTGGEMRPSPLVTLIARNHPLKHRPGAYFNDLEVTCGAPSPLSAPPHRLYAGVSHTLSRLSGPH